MAKTINFNLTSMTIVLSIVFMVLKLNHVIDWSWWFVFLPVLIPVVFFLFSMTLLGLAGVLIYLLKK